MILIKKKWVIKHFQWRREKFKQDFSGFRWERRVDNRGRVYYVDHNTRTTTWQRPSTDFVQNVQNWQQHWNNNRSQAFENLQNRTLFNTSAVPAALQDDLGPLPEGWGR